MPYIDIERSIQINNKDVKPTEPGDWNWAYTVAYIILWKETPRYKTYHQFVKTINMPEYIMEIANVTQYLYDCICETPEGQMLSEIEIEDDLQAARFAAVQEFHRRVIAPYENMKMVLPTQDDPYKRLEVTKHE